jgi:hypothetical protein
MNLSTVRARLTYVALFSFALSGCSEGQSPPVVEYDFTGDGGVIGCSQPSFPDDQPDLSVLQPPIFVTDAPNGQPVVTPGDPIDAEITVNGATRYALVELRDAWATDTVNYAEEVDTPGNETISLILFSDPQLIGRYYMRITLCGFDCNERSVIFDINPDVNSDYERTLIENGEIVRVDRTCIDLGATPGRGSGTILIQ